MRGSVALFPVSVGSKTDNARLDSILKTVNTGRTTHARAKQTASRHRSLFSPCVDCKPTWSWIQVVVNFLAEAKKKKRNRKTLNFQHTLIFPPVKKSLMDPRCHHDRLRLSCSRSQAFKKQLSAKSCSAVFNTGFLFL